MALLRGPGGITPNADLQLMRCSRVMGMCHAVQDGESLGDVVLPPWAHGSGASQRLPFQRCPSLHCRTARSLAP